jgi:hypothetical protein
MIPLVMVNITILFQHVPESALPKQDQLRQALFLDGSHPALRVGIQVRRSRRERYTLHPRRVDDLLKRRTEFFISIMDQVLPRLQESPVGHRHVARDLHHPAPIRMGHHTRDMDLPAA